MPRPARPSPALSPAPSTPAGRPQRSPSLCMALCLLARPSPGPDTRKGVRKRPRVQRSHAGPLGSCRLRGWLVVSPNLFLVRLTLFCFEFLGLSLVDKGKLPHCGPPKQPPSCLGCPPKSSPPCVAQTRRPRPWRLA